MMPIFEIVSSSILAFVCAISSAILAFACAVALRRGKTGKGDAFRILFPIIAYIFLIAVGKFLYVDSVADKKKEDESEIGLRQYEEVRKIKGKYPEIQPEIHSSMDDGYISNAEFEQIKAAVERAKISRVKSSLTKKEKTVIDSKEWEKMLKEIDESLKRK